MADEPDETAQDEPEPESTGPEAAGEATQPYVQAAIRDVAFPVSVRGYDRRSVDAYVQQVNRLIAELEIGRSPQAAVRHALERVSEQTRGILEEARQAAEGITVSAHDEAQQTLEDARTQAEAILAKAQTEAREVLERADAAAGETVERAHADAAAQRQQAKEAVTKLQADAETRLGELRQHIAAARDERAELLGQIERVAARLEELVQAEHDADEALDRDATTVPLADERQQPAQKP